MKEKPSYAQISLHKCIKEIYLKQQELEMEAKKIEAEIEYRKAVYRCQFGIEFIADENKEASNEGLIVAIPNEKAKIDEN